MKKIIGIIMLVFAYVFLIGASCVAYGVKTALIIWALGFLFAIIIAVAILFITED